MKAETTLDSLRSNQAEKVQKCFGERNAASASSQEVISSLLRIIKAWEVEKDKAADMLPKIKKLYEHARAKVMGLRSADVS